MPYTDSTIVLGSVYSNMRASTCVSHSTAQRFAGGTCRTAVALPPGLADASLVVLPLLPRSFASTALRGCTSAGTDALPPSPPAGSKSLLALLAINAISWKDLLTRTGAAQRPVPSALLLAAAAVAAADLAG